MHKKLRRRGYIVARGGVESQLEFLLCRHSRLITVGGILIVALGLGERRTPGHVIGRAQSQREDLHTTPVLST